ncbi:MAG: preprotein translocase subunit SecE [Oscillospiraceae bacterium]|nr:preprotein translocase subunit SecE [Oscillospiraceae bacterium]
MAANDKNNAVKVKKENGFVKVFKKIRKGVNEIRIELKRVTWPTWKELFNYTVTVLIVCIIMGVLIYLLDIGLKQVLLLTLDIGA